MTTDDAFAPDWASPPGDTVLDLLDELSLTLREFAEQMGEAPESLNELIEGVRAITPSTAVQLERVLGPSSTFWLTRDSQYWRDRSRLGIAHAAFDVEKEWLKSLPISDMVSFGWLPRTQSTSEQVAQCLRFFGVETVGEWKRQFRQSLQCSAFRTSPSFKSLEGSVAAWIRRGEIQASGIECRTWNSARFGSLLWEFRALTRKPDPKRFLPELVERCAECGVAVVVARAPSGCRASGATRFLSSSKALLLLSFRYLADDHFWFTFFHEAGHLMLHGMDSVFVEGIDASGKAREDEANDFAARLLVPLEARAEMLALRNNAREIIRFAQRIGISPGIVVGQLQHAGTLARHQMNTLKRRYKWE